MSLADLPAPLELWRQELYSELDPADVLAQEGRRLLDRLFADVFSQASDEPMHMALYVPEGIAVDSKRLAAVRDWCQGFLFGLGLGGSALTKRLSAPARELLSDLSEVTRMDTDDVENNEENQSALIEIEEFVRVGVLLIRDELNARQGPHESE